MLPGTANWLQQDSPLLGLRKYNFVQRKKPLVFVLNHRKLQAIPVLSPGCHCVYLCFMNVVMFSYVLCLETM